MMRYRVLFAALLVAAAAIAAPLRAAQAAPQGPPHETAVAKETAGEEPSAGGGWGAAIAKTVNFAILVGVLVYFLRTPLMGYLLGRIAKVREDLVTAAETRETAARRLAEIDARIKALPMELEALRVRGAEDIADERRRIEEAAEAERRRLLEHTRREIETRLRVARRELLELAADLAVRVAGDRIERSITPDDHIRLVDRYAAQLQARPAGGEAQP